jgi:hypothetical protein
VASYNLVRRDSKPCIEQAVGGGLDLMALIGGAEEWVAILWEKIMWPYA